MNELPPFPIVFREALACAKVSFPIALDLTWKRILLPFLGVLAIGMIRNQIPANLLFLCLAIATIIVLSFALPASGGLMELALATVQGRDRRFDVGYGWEIFWVGVLRALLFFLFVIPIKIAKLVLRGSPLYFTLPILDSVTTQLLEYRYYLTTAILIAEDSGTSAIGESWRIGKGCGFRLTLYALAVDVPVTIVCAAILYLTGGWDVYNGGVDMKNIPQLLEVLPRLMLSFAAAGIPLLLFGSCFAPFFQATLYNALRGAQKQDSFITIVPEGV